MKIKSRFVTKLVARIVVGSLRLLFRTVRKEFAIHSPGTLAYYPLQERFLYCTWHDSIIMPLFMGDPCQMAALTSRHQDGSYLAETMARLGIRPVRGSSGRSGAQALREAMEIVQDWHLTITPDGPRGPRRQMKDGILYLASRSRRRIVPAAFHCTSFWRLNGRWTDLLIPKPFSRVTMFLGEPLEVPEDLSRDQMAEQIQRMQRVMDEFYATAEGTSLPDAEISRRAA